MSQFVDAHCHLDLAGFSHDVSTVIHRASLVGVTRFIVAGVEPDGWCRQRSLAELYPQVHWAAGLHPVSCASLTDSDFLAALEALPQCFEGSHPACAVGETGLDRLFAPADSIGRQRASFQAHLSLANRFQKPVVIHAVKAHGPVLDELGICTPVAGGIVHSFSGSKEVARRYLDLGLSISIAPSGVRPAARRTHEAIKMVPTDRLIVETDSPEQSVRPGAPGEPAEVLVVANRIAKIRGCARDEILRHSAANCERVFGLTPGE